MDISQSLTGGFRHGSVLVHEPLRRQKQSIEAGAARRSPRYSHFVLQEGGARRGVSLFHAEEDKLNRTFAEADSQRRMFVDPGQTADVSASIPLYIPCNQSRGRSLISWHDRLSIP